MKRSELKDLIKEAIMEAGTVLVTPFGHYERDVNSALYKLINYEMIHIQPGDISTVLKMPKYQKIMKDNFNKKPANDVAKSLESNVIQDLKRGFKN